jgi:hypothetical protein
VLKANITLSINCFMIWLNVFSRCFIVFLINLSLTRLLFIIILYLKKQYYYRNYSQSGSNMTKTKLSKFKNIFLWKVVID